MRYKRNSQSCASSVKLATVFHVFYLSSILLIVCVYTRCNTLFYTCILSVKQRRRRKKNLFCYIYFCFMLFISRVGVSHEFVLSDQSMSWIAKRQSKRKKNEENSKWIIKKRKTKYWRKIFRFFPSHQEKKKQKNALINRGKAKENIIILCIVAGLMEKNEEKRWKKVKEIFMKIKENYAVSEMKKKEKNPFSSSFLFHFSGLEKWKRKVLGVFLRVQRNLRQRRKKKFSFCVIVSQERSCHLKN